MLHRIGPLRTRVWRSEDALKPLDTRRTEKGFSTLLRGTEKGVSKHSRPMGAAGESPVTTPA
jgi:hypothetical protein